MPAMSRLPVRSGLGSDWARRAALGVALWAAGAALAQSPPAAAAASGVTVTAVQAGPAGFVAPAEPRPDESNGERARSQPGNNAPLWRSVRDSAAQAGHSSLPAAESGVLIQGFTQYPGSALTTAGEAWRQVRNQWIIPYGGALIFMAMLALAIFYKTKGPLGGHLPDTGRKVERFTPFERAAHWANAGAFVALAVSGLVMAFGKFILLPIVGATLFGWLTWALKTLHNFVGPLFVVSLLVVVVTFIKDNIANKADFVWLSKAGGMLGDKEVPSHRFNAGEKGLFWWGVTIPGLFIVASGLVLDKLVPGLGELRGQMQVAHMVHAVAAMIMVTALIGHIYMGTVGVKGALDGMRTGYVDEAWGQEHHQLWMDDIRSGKIPAQRSGVSSPATVGMQAAGKAGA